VAPARSRSRCGHRRQHAVNGVCLTVVARAPKSFGVDVSRETLRCTAGLDEPGEITSRRRCGCPTVSAAISFRGT